MKVKMKFRYSLFLVILLVVNSLPAQEEEQVVKNEMSTQVAEQPQAKVVTTNYSSVWSSGSGLPDKVGRVSMNYLNFSGSEGFGADHNAHNLGLDVNVNMTAIQMEYGLSENLTVGVALPIITENSASLNVEQFKKSKVYQDNLYKYKNMAAQLLMATPFCNNMPDCMELLSKPLPMLPGDPSFTLPTGEVVTLPKNVPIEQSISQLLVRQATPHEGAKGLGDLEVGAVYNFIKDGPFRVALGAGLGFPTGKFTDVPAGERATGYGNYLAKTRLNLDASPLPGIWMGFQYQLEKNLGSADLRADSMLDNSKVLDSTYKYERGLLQTGFLQAACSLGIFSGTLNPFAFIMEYQFKRKEADKVDGSRDYTQFPDMWETNLMAKVRALLPKSLVVPMMAELSYTLPLAGKNVLVSTNALHASLKAYFRF